MGCTFLGEANKTFSGEKYTLNRGLQWLNYTSLVTEAINPFLQTLPSIVQTSKIQKQQQAKLKKDV